ncbi:MAG: Omp28-related outer membrane protein [Bacteroidia bacterium]
MKRNTPLLILAILAVGLITGCKEMPPFIDMTPEVVDTTLTDTTYVASTTQASQQKNVLIEDFTGVRCPNCPAAQVVASTIADENPGRVVVVSLHPSGSGVGALVTPLDESKYDFRRDAAADILSLLGLFNGLPIGAVDRIKFEQNILITDAKWKGYTQQRLQVETPVNLILETEYDAALNEVVITTELHYTQDVSEENYISIGILESHMIDWQKDDQVYVEDYEHNHVLREMITISAGKKLTPQLEKGRVIIKQYRVKLNPEYVAENLDIVAFVHQKGSGLDVLQVQQKAVVQ